jgi:hypothetical protein
MSGGASERGWIGGFCGKCSRWYAYADGRWREVEGKRPSATRAPRLEDYRFARPDRPGPDLLLLLLVYLGLSSPMYLFQRKLR